MAKHFRTIVDKIDDTLGAISILFFDLINAASYFIVFFLILPTSHFTILHQWCFRIYIILVLLLTLFGEIHFFRWFIFDGKQNVNCHNCGENVVARRIDLYNADDYSPVEFFYPITSSLRIIRLQICRPISHYKCPECGHEEYICPYCHKPVHKDDEKCPHCKKRMIRDLKI